MIKLCLLLSASAESGEGCSLAGVILLFAGLVCEQIGVGADWLREDLIELARDAELVLL